MGTKVIPIRYKLCYEQTGILTHSFETKGTRTMLFFFMGGFVTLYSVNILIGTLLFILVLNVPRTHLSVNILVYKMT